VAYVTQPQVQSWLNRYKYLLEQNGFDPQFDKTAADFILPYLSRRYDTSTWTNNTNTPALVIDLMAMLAASYTLRVAISEDDGIHEYADWLEKRVMDLVDAIVEGSLTIPGVTPSPTAPSSESINFYPDDAATQTWLDNPFLQEGAARAFTMEQIF
jgi:hypothetical protein